MLRACDPDTTPILRSTLIMASGHCHITLYSRGRRRPPSKGRRASAPRKRSGSVVVRPAAAACAYRFGIALVDPRTGVVQNHTDRDDITHRGIVADRPSPLTESAQAFVNAIEAAELRSDSHLFRDIQPAVPHELVAAKGMAAAAALVESMATAVSEHFHTAAAWVVHPTGEGDTRNTHGHIMLPTRRLDEHGQLGEKIRDLSTYTTSGREIAWMKNTWRDLANAALVEAGLDVEVHVGRRLDRAPVQTLPKAVAGQERRKRRRRRRDEYRDAAGPGNEGAADALADEDTRAPLREQISQDAAEEQRAQLELSGLADAASPDTVARLRTPILATQAARLAGDHATAERREASTGRVVARYAPRARSRRERWLERKHTAPGQEQRPRHEKRAPIAALEPESDTPPSTPRPARKRKHVNPGDETAHPGQDAQTRTPRPPRKRRRRTPRPDRTPGESTQPPPTSLGQGQRPRHEKRAPIAALEPESDTPPRTPRPARKRTRVNRGDETTQPGPDARTRTPRPPRNRRRRAPRPDRTPRESTHGPRVPPTSRIARELDAAAEPMGLAIIRTAGRDPKGADQAWHQIKNHAPTVAASEDLRKAAARATRKTLQRRGILAGGYRPSPQERDQACTAWSDAIRTDLADIIADLLKGFLDALEKRAEAKRKAAATTTRRHVHLSPADTQEARIKRYLDGREAERRKKLGKIVRQRSAALIKTHADGAGTLDDQDERDVLRALRENGLLVEPLGLADLTRRSGNTIINLSGRKKRKKRLERDQRVQLALDRFAALDSTEVAALVDAVHERTWAAKRGAARNDMLAHIKLSEQIKEEERAKTTATGTPQAQAKDPLQRVREANTRGAAQDIPRRHRDARSGRRG